MNLFLIVLLPFATQAASNSQICYTGTVQINGKRFTEDDIMKALEPDVNNAVLAVANGDPKLLDFLRKSGNCQADCLAMTMQPTFSTLYGKLGPDFVKRDKNQEIFVEALFGAFRACYPHPPREDVKKVAKTIVAGIGVTQADKPFPTGTTCIYQGHENDFPLNEFLQSFEATIMQVMQKKPDLNLYFDTQAKDCQKTCLQKTVPASVMTLFLTGNEDADAGVDALSGAIHACFPGVPHEDINILVSETKDVMDKAEAEATSARLRRKRMKTLSRRRYPTSKKAAGSVKEEEKKPQPLPDEQLPDPLMDKDAKEQDSGSFSFFTWGFVFFSSLALLGGLAVGRRWKRSYRFGAYQLVPTTFGRATDMSSNSLPPSPSWFELK